MVKQDVKITIEDVASLILSLDVIYYCTVSPNENELYEFSIMDYCTLNNKYTIGEKFRLTIRKDRVDIFYFPTLNISVPFKDESEFHEILSLYLDFKKRVEEFLIGNLKNMIKKAEKHKNPFFGPEAFMDHVRVNEEARPRRNFINNEMIDQLRREADRFIRFDNVEQPFDPEAEHI